MVSKTYGVDVAVYQPTDLANYQKAGASFAIVKLTEGTDYFNPRAMAQVSSARANHLYTHAYHFANFGSSVAQAKREAKYFLTWAEKTNISKKRMLWLDWESSPANRVDGARSANTAAILAFMQALKAAGYRPGLYSGAALMRSAIDTKQVIAKFGTCLWVASYPTMDPVSAANFNYFPSMDGVSIWQFTSNWHGLNVDGNVALVDLNHATESKKAAPKKAVKAKPKAMETFLAYAPVINNDPNWKIALRDGDGRLTGKYIKTNSRWKVFDTKQMKGGTWYKLGTDQQWAPAAYLKKI